MKYFIIKELEDNIDDEVKVFTKTQADSIALREVNNTTANSMFVIKKDGVIISLSGRYYKFAYKTLRDVKNALTVKYGKDLSMEMIEKDIIQVIKVIV